MANFWKDGKNVDSKVLVAPGAKSYELGLWGPIDYNGKELKVDVSPPNPIVKAKAGGMMPGKNVRVWQLSGLPVGPTLIVATSNDVVWTQVTIDTTAGKHTTNPNERLVARTPLPPAGVVAVLRAAWPDLTENGVRTLTAQVWLETKGGKSCFNWNIGNQKAPDVSMPHIYLRGTWECGSESQVAVWVASGGRVATEEEVKKHGWQCGGTTVVFSPPHEATRFRAFDSLGEGAQRLIDHHRRIAAREATYLADLNGGDAKAVARELAKDRYYTLKEPSYAAAIRQQKVEVDRLLGPVPAEGPSP